MKNRQNIYKIASTLLILDQIIKIIIKYNMNLYDKIIIIKNFFSILYLKNTGAAFSLFKDSTFILIIISVIFIIILDKYIRKEQNSLNKMDILSFGLIMGGIFGNLIDRIIHKGVIDYLSFKIINYSFPVFNFADICITIGTLLIILNLFFSKEKMINKDN